MIIDGKKISDDMYSDLTQEIEKIEGNKPTLGVIIVGDNQASLKYIAQKKKFSEKVGMTFILLHLPEKTSEEELLNNIDEWNNNEKMSGYMVQLPLPKHIDEQKVIHAIDPEKDVDGFHPVNQGKILIGDKSGFAPCTPQGVMKIQDSQEKIFLLPL